jgi:hypothetical protein
MLKMFSAARQKFPELIPGPLESALAMDISIFLLTTVMSIFLATLVETLNSGIFYRSSGTLVRLKLTV